MVRTNNMLSNRIDDLGFAVIPEVFEGSEITSLLYDLGDLDHRRGRAGTRHVLGHRAVRAIANDVRLTRIAQAILGPDAFPFRATFFDKSPDSNWLIAWHQDTALPLQGKREIPGWGPWSVKEGVNYAHAPASALEQILALRLHLDDSSAENGPLRVLPGTHKTGVLSDDEIERSVGKEQPAECLIPRGGVLAMRPLLIHASSKSTSAVPRRVLHVEYAPAVQIGDGLELARA